MTLVALGQFAIYLAVLVALVGPLGLFIARAFEGRPPLVGRLTEKIEGALLSLAGPAAQGEMTWAVYARALLLFNAASAIVAYVIQRAQGVLPLNPAGLDSVPPLIALNTAISFASNTNWQVYGGETTMSPFTQMTALTTQNFVSAGAGIAVLLALVRGLRGAGEATIGNFWRDLVRATVSILLPLSIVLGVVLVATGVPQTFVASRDASRLETDGAGTEAPRIALGPVASQVAIKQLGTNGGGFYNVNSAHPLENPGAVSNLAQSVAILLVPAALCVAFGRLIGDPRQGRALLAAMFAVFVPLVIVTGIAEGAQGPDGNLEGKEVRFGVFSSALWAVATTAASNGSVNAMHDSFTPLGGLPLLALMQIGEVIFGGVGSGLYGMLAYVIVAVFLAGLMVGRTPEYLGKKIEAFEMKMATLVLLAPSLSVLAGTALATVVPAGTASLGNPGAHGFSEILYAFSSGANNNGSAFAGLNAATPFYAITVAVAMLVGRYAVIVAVLAIAGSLAAKRHAAAGPGTLETHTPLFVSFLVATIVLVGALTFLPALALGPIVEHLR